MWRAALAIVLGICAEVVVMAVGETVGLAAAFVAVATYFCVCQFLLSRGHADALRKDWRIMLALAAPLLLSTIPMVLLEKPEVVLSQGPVVLFGCAGIFGGAMAASRAARRWPPRPTGGHGRTPSSVEPCIRTLAASLVISLAFGVAIWALSPLVTGSAEPWDANSGYYVVALIIAGLIAGFLFPGKTWPVLVGLVTGQFVYMLLFLPTGPLIGVGILALFIYGLFAVAAASGGSRLRRAWQAPGVEPGNGA